MTRRLETATRWEQLPLFRRVRLHTSRQTRELEEVDETVEGTILRVFPEVPEYCGADALVRFDGEWELGSCRGCTLLVPVDDLEAA